MTINKQYLRNDNVKWHNLRVFAPDINHWKVTCAAFRQEWEGFYAGCKPLTLEDAVQRAEKDSSAGFKWKKLRGCPKKRDVFEKNMDLLVEELEAISRGEDVSMVWELGPKCEMRPIDKFTNPNPEKRKQRTFMISDTTHYIVGLMLYAEQNDAMLSLWNRSDSWSAAGMNPFYGGWNQLASLLTAKGDNFRCWDVEAMEASVHLRIQEQLYAARNFEYEHDVCAHRFNLKNLARWYFKVLTCAPLVDLDGKVWVRVGMNPSGQYNTLADNIHALHMVFMYHLSFSEKCVGPGSLVQLRRELIVKMMGDDSIVSDHPIWEGVLQRSLELGFNITEEIEGVVPINRSKFCGFGWHWYDGMYIYRADADRTICSILYNMKLGSWRYLFVKLCAAKILLFGAPQFHEVTAMIAWVRKHKYDEMVSEVQHDVDLPLHSVLSQEKNFATIAQLVVGQESKLSL